MQSTEVLIMGGGLAGLTLAIQLRQRFPQLEVRVLEQRVHPVPVATHKVGEATVEIGAQYLSRDLGLAQHLESGQLRKFGFRFFFSDRRRDLDRVTELGVSRHLATPTYQLDRGLFENHLGARARECGALFLDGATVTGFQLGTDGPHEVSYAHDGREHHVRPRWLIDASGRAGLIKRRLALAERNAHDANAVWFRIGGRIDLDGWSHDPGFRTRCDTPRWLSTNHLIGEGYWVWLIPLASGSHSVGIVADAKLHPLARMSSFDRALEWLQQHQPRLAEELDGRRGELQDFLFLRRFSYGCKRVFSGERWALTGESGVFLDPFYSPGTDFIAIANTYIAELVARDLEGAALAPHARYYEQLFLSFYRSTLSLYVDQYPLFGDPEVMPVKVLWDYTYYWGVLCQLYFQGRLADLGAIGAVRGELASTLALNEAVQALLRAWASASARRNPATMIDQAALGWFAELNRGLLDRLDTAGFTARMRENAALLHGLAAEIATRAAAEHPTLDVSALLELARAGAAAAPAGLLRGATLLDCAA